MSTEPCGADFGKTYEAIAGTRYVTLGLQRKDWCGFEGQCKLEATLIGGRKTCMVCKHMKPIDIPELIEKKLEKLYV